MGSRLEKNSEEVRKRIAEHTFTDEGGEEYSASTFGGFRDYLRRKKIKLQNLDAQLRSESNEPQIFRNIVIYVNGYTQPSLADLHTAVVMHGGGFQQYLDGKTMVTHVIAGGLTPKKKLEFARYRCVLPQWIVDSIAAGKLLSWQNYRVADEGKNQKLLSFSEKGLVSQTNTREDGYRKQTDASWYTEQVKEWANELHEGLHLSKRDYRNVFSDNYKDDFHDPTLDPIEDHNLEDISESEEQIDALAPLSSDPMGYKPPSFTASPPKPSINIELASPVDTNELEKSFQGVLTTPPWPSAQPDPYVQDRGTQIINKAAAPSTRPDPRRDDVLNLEAASHLPNALPSDQPKSTVAIQVSSGHEEVSSEAQPDPLPIPEFKGEPWIPTSAQPEPAAELQKHTLHEHQDSAKVQGSKAVNKAMTAEEHNTILLSDPHMAKSSTANPDFINQYYRESRLHHLSTWKAELKAQLQARAQASSSQHQKPKRSVGTRRYIMHVDFDSFFAAVSLRKHPQWKDRPVVIAHGSGPGSEIASCNYPARDFGVKNGMWMKTALELCSDLKVLPYDYAAYEEASKHFYDAILAIDGVVQSISIDEALIDVSELCIRAGGSDGKGMSEGSIYREQAKANEIATALRASVREQTDCEVSVGIGNNILLAKVALRKAKPAGQHLIKPEEVLEFLGELTVTSLPGVAYSIGNKLEEIGVKYVKDIRSLTKEKLIQTLGPKTGEKIWDYSRGIDRQEVGEQVVRKSVSTEVNWGIRFRNQEEAETFMYSLCEELSRRLVEQNVKGKQITMKIMRKAADAGMDPPKNLGHGKCDTFNKSVALGVATNDKAVLAKETVTILRGYGFPPGELRGLGVQVQKLEPVKVVPEGSAAAVESSQRRLQFKKSLLEGQRAAQKSPAFSRERSSTPKPDRTPTKPSMSRVETIEEVPSDEEPSIAKPAPKEMPSVAQEHDRSHIPGTQFVLPTEVDPSVLAELPEDVRSMLAPKQSKVVEQVQKAEVASNALRSRSQSPFVSDAEALIPNQSQLDPAVLAELPEDVRKELLAEYNRLNPDRRLQRTLPQSPRKTKTLPRKVNVTPKKRRGGARSSKSRASNTSGLVQTNFMKPQPGRSDLIEEEEISEELLNELPEDIRKEIIADRKQKRLQRTGGIGIRRRPGAKFKRVPYVKMPPRLLPFEVPPRPTFTTDKVTTLPELRQAMADWVEFATEADEPPDSEDIAAISDYLHMVVAEEHDITKARAVVEWLEYTIDDQLAEDKDHLAMWDKAVATMKAGIQNAMASRGLAPVKF